MPPRKTLPLLNQLIAAFPKGGDPAALVTLHAERLPYIQQPTSADILAAHPGLTITGDWDFVRQHTDYAIACSGYLSVRELAWKINDLTLANTVFEKP